MTEELHIARFTPADQAEAKALILAGMKEHWGFIDPTLNPDLNDIAASYGSGIFLVGRLDGRLVATGALKHISTDSAEICRMSVAGDLRRLGLGRQMIVRVIEQARELGCKKIVLETTADWQDVVAFYDRAGFTRTEIRDGDQWFELIL
jgi:putative acetyltransferase